MKERMTRHGIGLPVRRAVHALLKRSTAAGEIEWACTPPERAAVPAHKRLENAAPGCGIAIGNLSSQFFANVYLDALDQFVKHELKAQRYLRYVDDFILVHHSRAQLVAWQAAIARFLAENLRLELKPGSRLAQLSCGIDFLGYVIYPRHVAVRRRVIDHAREKLDAWRLMHVHRDWIRATPAELRELRSICASYAGHFSHANTWRLRQQFRRRYTWLGPALRRRRLRPAAEGHSIRINRPRGIHRWRPT
jgi:RNA-directed DNA polymerase